MRNPSDLPPRGPASIRTRRFSDKGRIALIAVAVIVVGLLLFGRFFAGFFTDYLWFDSVGRAGVSIGWVPMTIVRSMPASLCTCFASKSALACISMNARPLGYFTTALDVD